MLRTKMVLDLETFYNKTMIFDTHVIPFISGTNAIDLTPQAYIILFQLIDLYYWKKMNGRK